MNIQQPPDGCWTERLGGGGPMMEFDPDDDAREPAKKESEDERRG